MCSWPHSRVNQLDGLGGKWDEANTLPITSSWRRGWCPISYFQDCIAMVFFPNCATSNAKSHRLPCHHCCLLNLQLKPACFQIPLSTVASAWLWAGCALNVLHAKKCPTHKRKKMKVKHMNTHDATIGWRCFWLALVWTLTDDHGHKV